MIKLISPKVKESREYRCIKCKMKCLDLSTNVYQIECGNCGTIFDFPELTEYERLLQEVRNSDAALKKEKTELESQIHFLEKATFENKEKVMDKVMMRLAEIRLTLMEQQRGRLSIKRSTPHVNIFLGEGAYYCVVSNIRGGSIKVCRCSEIAWVIVERPQRAQIKMLPWHIPRRRVMRKRWNMYKSLLGNFSYGDIYGIVKIRFDDDAVYEGPYVEEKHVDATGRVNHTSRVSHHYGYYTCSDGRIFEGGEVDNHFSPLDLNGTFKLTVPGQYVYEGEWSDEKMHGVGVCKYVSGDVYQGQWHLNEMFGIGQYKSVEGWIYEGYFNLSRRHGEGSMRWASGEFYIGNWMHNKRNGKGILLTRILDVYQGEFCDDQLSGMGEMYYGNGSKYIGNFRENVRNGKGRFVEKDGCEYYGEYQHDVKEGEFVVKYMTGNRKDGIEEFEIRIGNFKNGSLLEWKRVINKKMTEEFVEMYYKNRSLFDGVYSMIIAKSLPRLPSGLDPGNREIQLIIDRIRVEGGKLISDEPLKQALTLVKAILSPIRLVATLLERCTKIVFRDVESSIRAITTKIDALNYSQVLLGFQKKKSQNAVMRQEVQVALHYKEIEEYFGKESTQARKKFDSAVRALSSIKLLEFQFMKTHHSPPIFTKRIMDAFSFLLGESSSWEHQHLLLSDHRDNIRAGDAYALTHSYECRLVHLYQTFNIFQRYNVDFEKAEGRKMMNTLADPKYRRNTYYIESQGKAAPIMIDMIQANILYVRAAQKIHKMIAQNNHDSINLHRMKLSYANISSEYSRLQAEIDNKLSQLHDFKLRLARLEGDLVVADDMVGLMHEFYGERERSLHGLDYYEQLEVAIESKLDTFALESCLESILSAVEERLMDEKKSKMREARAMGVVYEEERQPFLSIATWITEAVHEEQSRLPEDMGVYSCDNVSTVSDTETWHSVARCASKVVHLIDKYGNEKSSSQLWVMLNGKKIPKRVVFPVIWHYWQKECHVKEVAMSIRVWNETFGSPEECSRKAISSRFNFRMTSTAKRQGQLWAEVHPELISSYEGILSNEFETLYPQSTAQAAIRVMNDDTQKFDPDILARAYCWNKLHPSLAREALEYWQHQKAREFADHFGSAAASVAIALNSGAPLSTANLEWSEHAQHWRSFHTEEYFYLEKEIISRKTKEFMDDYPDDAHINAAKIIVNHDVCTAATEKYPSIPCSFMPSSESLERARCWGISNQPKMESGLLQVKRDFRMQCHEEWEAMRIITEDFSLGSKRAIVGSDDLYADMRANLLHKNIWLIGYLLYTRAELSLNIENLRHLDPLKEISDVNIRPSKLKEMKEIALEENLNAIKSKEKELMDIVERLSVWFSYFGTS